MSINDDVDFEGREDEVRTEFSLEGLEGLQVPPFKANLRRFPQEAHIKDWKERPPITHSPIP